MFELILAGILFGGITTGARFLAGLGLSLYEISFFTLGLATLMLFPFAINQKMNWKKLKFLALYGLGGALLQLAGFSGIILQVPVAIVSFFMYSQPIWTVFLSIFFLKEKIDKKKLLAVFFAIVGVIILVNLASVENYNIWGIIAPLIGGFLLSVWVVGGRKIAIEKEPASFVTFAYCGFTTIWLILIYPFFKKFVPQPMFSDLSFTHSTTIWFHLIWIILISRVISNWLFYRGMKRIEASRTGIIILIEPISVAVISAIAFSQPITVTLALGGGLILLANYLVIFNRKNST
ncbi:MAG: DMT family transporter [Candidatus Nealsonbacteria bacterium]|nr:DMT family transporter [Candidatus Nealsonbacteria bacterium]